MNPPTIHTGDRIHHPLYGLGRVDTVDYTSHRWPQACVDFGAPAFWVLVDEIRRLDLPTLDRADDDCGYLHRNRYAP